MRKLLTLIIGLLLTLSVSGQMVGVVASQGASGVVLNPQNLLLYSEDITNVVWVEGSVVKTEGINGANDLEGNATLDLCRGYSSGGSYMYQDVTVLASTNYVFSFDYIRGTWGDATWNIWSYNTGSAVVAITSYYATTSGSVSRQEFSFTTPAGCTSIAVRPLILVPGLGNCYLGRMQLCEASRLADGYIETTSTKVDP